jgi:ABC-2 type transport system ATP-binding protein
MSIQVNKLVKKFGNQTAVNEISFAAESGSITGFLGPNGAGKSTTMKMITGYLVPDGGKALVCGIDVAANPLPARQKIGYLPESNALYFDMYVKEYLEFTAGVYKVPMLEQAVYNVIEQVGLGPEYKKKIGQLSKGYKQRVGLAAAIIHEPEVLILDEPTSGLDPNQIVEIRNLIKDLSKAKTVLLSTHIMQEVEAICDNVIIIHQGNIVANEKLAELKKKHAAPGLRISLKERLEPEWFARLETVSLVEKLDAYNWQLSTTDVAAARKQVMQLAIDQNLNIVSMQEGGSLEELFRKLTIGT